MPLQHGTRLSAVMTDISNNRLSLCLLHELAPACYTALVTTRSFYGGKWKNQTGLCARAVLDLSNKNHSFESHSRHEGMSAFLLCCVVLRRKRPCDAPGHHLRSPTESLRQRFSNCVIPRGRVAVLPVAPVFSIANESYCLWVLTSFRIDPEHA
jgi:hypothetical protein